MTTATRIPKLNCEVHFYLKAKGRCSCPITVAEIRTISEQLADIGARPSSLGQFKAVAQPGSTAARPKQRYTIMSDEDGHYYYIPTDKEQAFEAWVAATVNGEEEDYYELEGEDFTEYAIGGALTRLTFENPLVN